MINSKVIMNVNIGNVNYCVFLSLDNNDVNALAIRNNGVSYFVTDINEINLLNTIINTLNKKYIRRRDITYKNKKIARFEHRYSGKSFFAEITLDDNLKECSYEEYKGLYDYYNGIKTLYLRRKDRKKIRENRKRHKKSYDINDDFETERNDLFEESDDSLLSSKYQRTSSNKRRRRNSKNNSIGKKIIIALGGTIVIATITAIGVSLLSSKELPQIMPEKTYQESSIENKQDNNNFSQIQREYGENIDINVNTESRENIQEKYKNIEKVLRENGLSNWEICAELDYLTVLHDESEKIDFYYDSDKDEIVYVFEELKEKIDDDKENLKEYENSIEISEVSSKIKIIIDAINENENLSKKEKKYIIDCNLPIWIQNEKYINVYEIADRYRNLTINYQKNIANVDLKNTPYDKASGSYTTGGRLIDSEESYNQHFKKKSVINIFNASSIEDIISEERGTLDHELNHINGQFSYYGSNNTLLNEGYTHLAVKEETNTYITEQCMAVLFNETFGNESMKEGYFGFDLNNALTNIIVEKTGKDNAIVNDEIYNLLQDTQDLLYDSGVYTKEGNEIKNNSDLIKRYENLFEKLSYYYEIVNERKMNENQIVNLVMDCITGTNRASIYKSNETYKEFISYDLDKESIICNVGNNCNNMELPNGEIIVSIQNSRKVFLNKDNKYSKDIPIKDSDINYSTR